MEVPYDFIPPVQVEPMAASPLLSNAGHFAQSRGGSPYMKNGHIVDLFSQIENKCSTASED